MGQPHPCLEGIESPFPRSLVFKIFRHHRNCHRQSRQRVPVLQLELLTWLAYFAAVYGPGIEQNQTASFAFDQLSLPNIGIFPSQFEPITMTPCHMGISLRQLILHCVVVSPRHHHESAHPVQPHIHQRNHALHAVEPPLIGWILIHMQILNVGIPTPIRQFVPPRPPTNERIETRNQRLSLPYLRERLFNSRMGAQIPGSFGVASPVGDEEADGATARPVVVLPRADILPLNATPQRLQPLPEQPCRLRDLLTGDHIPKDNEPITFKCGQPLFCLLEKVGLLLWFHLIILCSQDKYKRVLGLMNRASQYLMQLKSWLLVIRILNLVCAGMMMGFEIWYLIELFQDDKGFFVLFIRIFTPVFVILLAVTIITAEFKFAKVVEHFKFLQFIPGLALFNLFIASILAFQFSTLNNHVAPVITSILFVAVAAGLGIMQCVKPAGTESLLSSEE